MKVDIEILRQFYIDMAKADEVTFDPTMNHEELAKSLASTSGIDNQEELAEALWDLVIEGVARAAALQGRGMLTIVRAVAHASFELGHKMGLYAAAQTH
jgi:hypothetical protein